MISVTLARRLHDAGLGWRPALHDFFAIPERDLDDRVFVLADMSIDVEYLAGHAAIMFNGAVEWSLDYILRQDVVWLPTEQQLRELLGDRLVALTNTGDAWECRYAGPAGPVTTSGATAGDAYGAALLDLLGGGYTPPDLVAADAPPGRWFSVPPTDTTGL